MACNEDSVGEIHKPGMSMSQSWMEIIAVLQIEDPYPWRSLSVWLLISGLQRWGHRLLHSLQILMTDASFFWWKMKGFFWWWDCEIGLLRFSIFLHYQIGFFFRRDLSLPKISVSHHRFQYPDEISVTIRSSRMDYGDRMCFCGWNLNLTIDYFQRRDTHEFMDAQISSSRMEIFMQFKRLDKQCTWCWMATSMLWTSNSWES